MYRHKSPSVKDDQMAVHLHVRVTGTGRDVEKMAMVFACKLTVQICDQWEGVESISNLPLACSFRAQFSTMHSQRFATCEFRVSLRRGISCRNNARLPGSLTTAGSKSSAEMMRDDSLKPPYRFNEEWWRRFWLGSSSLRE